MTDVAGANAECCPLRILQNKLPDYLCFFQFVHNARRRGEALLGTLVATLVA